MHLNSTPSHTPSHSNELERRVTTIEVTQIERITANERRWTVTEARISYLERAVHGIIYVVCAIATSKSGDWVETILSITKAKL